MGAPPMASVWPVVVSGLDVTASCPFGVVPGRYGLPLLCHGNRRRCHFSALLFTGGSSGGTAATGYHNTPVTNGPEQQPAAAGRNSGSSFEVSGLACRTHSAALVWPQRAAVGISLVHRPKGQTVGSPHVSYDSSVPSGQTNQRSSVGRASCSLGWRRPRLLPVPRVPRKGSALAPLVNSWNRRR